MVFNQFFEHLYISLDSCDREKACLNLCLSTNKYPTFKPLIHTININKSNSSAIRTPIKYLKMARSPWKNENTKVQVFRFPCVLWCRVPCILCPLPPACVTACLQPSKNVTLGVRLTLRMVLNTEQGTIVLCVHVFGLYFISPYNSFSFLGNIMIAEFTLCEILHIFLWVCHIHASAHRLSVCALKPDTPLMSP